MTPPQKRLQPYHWLFWLLGISLSLIWIAATNNTLWSPIIAPDIQQHRLSTAVPIPQQTFTLQQTFTPHHHGLRQIDLTLVRHEGDDDNGRFQLQLQDDSGQTVAEANLDTRFLQHNDTYQFRFSPQRHSAHRQYTLQISGSPTNPITLWGYDPRCLHPRSIYHHPWPPPPTNTG